MNRTRSLVILLLLGLLLVYMLSSFTANSPVAVGRVVNGIIDLRNANIEGELLHLNGNWEFIPGRIVTPQQINKYNHHLIAVPSDWARQKINGQQLSPQGENTYVLTMVFPKDYNKTVGIKIDLIKSACRIFVNGELKVEQGGLGDKQEGFQPMSLPEAFYFKPVDDKAVIVVQCANYFTPYSGGIISSWFFGSEDLILRRDLFDYGADATLSAFFVLTIVIFLGMFVQRPAQKELWYFALFCLFLWVVLLFQNQRLAIQIYPDIDFSTMVKVENIAAIVSMAAMMNYYNVLLPDKNMAFLRKWVSFSGVLLILFTALTAAPTILYWAGIYFLWEACMGLLILDSMWRGIKRRVTGWVPLLIGLIGSLVIAWSITYDVIQGFDTLYILTLTVPLFLASQLYMLNCRVQQAIIDERTQASELKYLRAQIKPHFIYNALASIAALIRRNPDKARETLLDFSDLLRKMLKSGDENLTELGEEVDIAEYYARIEKTRFGERLDIEFNVPTELRGTRTPILTVHPLVENAIKHNMSVAQGVACVRVTAYRQADKVIICIADSGPGMTHETMRAVEKGKLKGIGLSNTRERLRRYGGDLRMESSEKGTVITVELTRIDADDNSR